MNADEKAKYEEEKRNAELEKREKDVNARELRITAYDTLAEKGFDTEQSKLLIPVLNVDTIHIRYIINYISNMWSRQHFR